MVIRAQTLKDESRDFDNDIVEMSLYCYQVYVPAHWKIYGTGRVIDLRNNHKIWKYK